jgi:hypothetical protein
MGVYSENFGKNPLLSSVNIKFVIEGAIVDETSEITAQSVSFWHRHLRKID